MKEGFEKQPISTQIPNWILIVATVLITTLVAGGGVFVWQNSKINHLKAEHQKKVQQLKQEIESLNQEIERLRELETKEKDENKIRKPATLDQILSTFKFID